jgi:uncharacterized RDD family membrane protein YckC
VDEIDRYLNAVSYNLRAASERERILADLRAHLEAAVQAGEPASAVITRMGSPEEVARAFLSQTALPYAGFGLRLVAFLIDMLIIFLAASVCIVLFIATSNLVPRHPQGLEIGLAALILTLPTAFALAFVGIIVLYFPILEGRFGQTLGKRLLNLLVVREDGLPIHYKEAFLRRISFYFEVFAIDALFVLFTAKRQRAFDIVARTVVVQNKA